MTLVAITSLRLYEPERQEWRSALDERWTSLLAACGLTPLLLPNDPAAALRLLQQVAPAGAILSGGGECAALSGAPDVRDQTEAAVLAWARRAGKPVLGICRGMQVLLAHAGAQLVALEGHVRTRHTIGTHEVNSFHGFGAFEAPGFEIRGRAEDGVVEWIENRTDRLTGIMWHPEREARASEQDIQLIQNVFGELR